MSSGEKIAIAALAVTVIIALAVGLWILEAPRKAREWLDRHSR